MLRNRLNEVFEAALMLSLVGLFTIAGFGALQQPAASEASAAAPTSEVAHVAKYKMDAGQA